MSRASLDELQRLITERLRQEPISAAVEQVLVSTPDDLADEDSPIVRVIVFVTDTEQLDHEHTAHARATIRDVVAEADDRVPSIRFSEAA